MLCGHGSSGSMATVQRVAKAGLALAALSLLWTWPGKSVAASEEEPVGKRPYEMDWAGRTKDHHPALVDFEDLTGWAVECQDAEARLARTRREQLWGRYVGTLTYRGTGPKPRVVIRPPEPVLSAGGFDCVNFWVYGNNWAWVPDPSTPPVDIAVVFRAKGEEVRVPLGRVHWREWWVMHRRLSPEQQALTSQGAALVAIEVTGGRNGEDRQLHFDNLSVYREALPPLRFEPRPLRNLTLPPGQTVGTNTGPGRLPFPAREETLLPDNLTRNFRVDSQKRGDTFVFVYSGDDGQLEYHYRPATGTLGDVEVWWQGSSAAGAKQPEPVIFRPLVDGGVVFAVDQRGGHGPVPASGSGNSQRDRRPEKVAQAKEPGKGGPVAPARLVDCRQAGSAVVARWELPCASHKAEVEYTFRLWQKSLVIDVACRGGHVEEFRFGRAVGLAEPRLVTLPYLTCDLQRPAVVVAGSPSRPLFLFGLVDYYRSNASALWAANRVEQDGVVYNGGARYRPKTDGLRNDCFERVFVTVSPRLEEVLPNIPNPQSPWMHVAGERLWIAHGASDRQKDYALWKEVARYGMTKLVITDHETGWRDRGESFTFRTRAAPGKGGDQGQAEYARKVRALGFRYGIYNNYTDFAPVNEFWNEDLVTRLPDGNWQTAWPRCYNPKPARAVEFEARLAPIIQQKFQLDTAYCDVHTAVAPWHYCDYDARVPGAGTFAATFYAYGEIMLHQKRTWNGPVYSEGNNHWYYCGLTDGNYGQDQAARLHERPWLVDFDLRKLHPLCCNFGMGNPGMFFGRNEGLGKTPEERDSRLDRFLAATLAFGHTGFLVMQGGMPSAVRSYFNVQQVHAAYAQATAVDIRYADAQGNLLESTGAVASGAYQRSQVQTRYSNGLVVTVNGHPKESWKIPAGELPPNGWHVSDPSGRLVAWSMIHEGHRADYVDSPAYVYADGRGRLTRFPQAVCDGQLVVHKRPDGTREVIPVGTCTEFGVALAGKGAAATALDEEGKSIGPAETRFARGLVYVRPVPKAFSYVLKPTDRPVTMLRSPREAVVPGETVEIAGSKLHRWTVPADAKPGSHVWHSCENAWIDFRVVPLVEARLTFDDRLQLHLVPQMPEGTKAGRVELEGHPIGPPLVPGKPWRFREPQPRAFDRAAVLEIPLRVTAGPLRFERSWWLKVEKGLVRQPVSWQDFQAGQRVRGGPESPLAPDGGALVFWHATACGGVTHPALFMHPPYRHGVGYSFALFDPVDLPIQPVAFRCWVGKADGSDPGDGVLFRVAVLEADGRETPVAEKHWKEHAWTALEADLAAWAGKRVRIKLVADVGPANNAVGDWAAWADLRLESLQPQWVATLHDQRP